MSFLRAFIFVAHRVQHSQFQLLTFVNLRRISPTCALALVVGLSTYARRVPCWARTYDIDLHSYYAAYYIAVEPPVFCFAANNLVCWLAHFVFSSRVLIAVGIAWPNHLATADVFLCLVVC